MAVLDARGHATRMDLQSSEQLYGAVSVVVVGMSLDLSWPHWQHRLGSIQRLHLCLLIDTQDDRVLRRVKVQPDHIDHLGNEVRIGRAGEGPNLMGLQLVLA